MAVLLFLRRLRVMLTGECKSDLTTVCHTFGWNPQFVLGLHYKTSISNKERTQNSTYKAGSLDPAVSTCLRAG